MNITTNNRKQFMNNSLLKILLLFILNFAYLFAQGTLPLPKEFKDAINKQTRSITGLPGQNYWQNRSNYKIDVNFNQYTGELKGKEEIIYFNNSPDTLSSIVIKLLHNMYKFGNARDFDLDSAMLFSGIDLLELKLNDSLISKDKIRFIGTNCSARLLEPLLPNSSIKINITWNITYPNLSMVRMGGYNNAFFIAYWFPQIAVYDDISGWDNLSYTGEVETYNDFSNFDVKITVPKNTSVWATGLIQNDSEIFKPIYLEKYRSAFTSDEIINIITQETDRKDVFLEKEFLTYHYKAENVTDFTFAVSDYYLWDAVSVVVDSSTNKRTLVQAAYNQKSSDFFEVADIARQTIQFMSHIFPRLAFPFPSITVFNGSGGMEFPMMINDGSTNSRVSTVGLTSHELAHMYFPFQVGINERKYAWMDEGMAVFLPSDAQKFIEPTSNQINQNIEAFDLYSGTSFEVPLDIPSYTTRRISYRLASYSRPAIAYYFLRDFLGDELFHKAMTEYVKRWEGKHPIPIDFFYTFNDVIKDDLSWYWLPWFYSKDAPDLGIISVNTKKNELKIKIENIGGLPIPVKLLIEFENGDKKEFYYKADVWKDKKKEKEFNIKADGKIVSISLSAEGVPDIDRSNNFYTLKK